MWAGTLCPLVSSTRNMAFGRASTTEPSISITPSFFGMSSTIRCSIDFCLSTVGPGTARRAELACTPVDLVEPSWAPHSPVHAHAEEQRASRCPGSREAPRERPTLGRHKSLRETAGQTRIGQRAGSADRVHGPDDVVPQRPDEGYRVVP